MPSYFYAGTIVQLPGGINVYADSVLVEPGDVSGCLARQSAAPDAVAAKGKPDVYFSDATWSNRSQARLGHVNRLKFSKAAKVNIARSEWVLGVRPQILQYPQHAGIDPIAYLAIGKVYSWRERVVVNHAL